MCSNEPEQDPTIGFRTPRHTTLCLIKGEHFFLTVHLTTDYEDLPKKGAIVKSKANRSNKKVGAGFESTTTRVLLRCHSKGRGSAMG